MQDLAVTSLMYNVACPNPDLNDRGEGISYLTLTRALLHQPVEVVRAQPPPISYIITLSSPDSYPNHGSEVSLPRAKIVGIFGIQNCSARIFTYCILKTDKVE